MPGIKYKFNPETLKYESIKRTPLKIVSYIFLIIISLLTVSVIAYFLVFQNFFDTPDEKMYKREYSQLLLQYNNLNKEILNLNGELSQLKDRDGKIYRSILGAKPLSDEIWEAGFGGSDKYKNLEQYKDAQILIETNKKLDKLKNQIKIQKQSYSEILGMARENENKMRSIPAIQPIANDDLKRFASGWGPRIHPIYNIEKFHYGIDFTADEGTEVYATGDGKVEDARKSQTYGNVITLSHGHGIKTLYAHLSEFKVKRGQKVKRGEVIGYVGNTGLSAGPHLHYEVMLKGKKVNPINYFFNDLSPDEYNTMIKLSANAKRSLD